MCTKKRVYLFEAFFLPTDAFATSSTCIKSHSAQILLPLSHGHTHPPAISLASPFRTAQERFGPDLSGRSVAWVGDGNNVLHDLLLGCARLGISVRISCPPEYMPDAGIMQTASDIAKASERE
jgi:ornithine carbamoyltransferase